MEEQYRLSISGLTSDVVLRFYVIGIVTNASKPTASQTEDSKIKYFFNFTVCDGHSNSINVCCWGSDDFVTSYSTMCYIGARVRISNPRVAIAADLKDVEMPQVTSCYQLHLEENDSSSIMPYIDQLEVAFHTPPSSNDTKKICVHDLTTQNSDLSEGEFVTLTAAVVEVSPHVHSEESYACKEVKLVDMSEKDMCVRLIISDPAHQLFADTWKAFSTVLQLTDVKIQVLDDRVSLLPSERSVLTMNPTTKEGHELAVFANEVEKCQQWKQPIRVSSQDHLVEATSENESESSIDSDFHSSEARFRQVSSVKQGIISMKEEKSEEATEIVTKSYRPKQLRRLTVKVEAERKLKEVAEGEAMIAHYQENSETACVFYEEESDPELPA